LAEDYLEHDLGHSGLDWSLFHIRVRRYLVLDPKHEKMTTYELSVDDNEELTQLEIVVTPPGKPPRRYSSADLIKQDKEKGKTLYKFAYPDMTNGTLIEVRREVRTVAKDNVLDLRHTMWLSHTLPCEKARISYSYPSRWSLLIKRTPAMRPLKRRSYYAGRGKQVVSYELADIPPQRDEAFSPSDRDDGVYVSFSLGYMTMGRRSYEGPKNWKGYAEQFKKYVVEKDAIFSRQVAQTTSQAKELWQSKRRFRPIEIPADLEFLRKVELRLPAEWTLITALKDNRVSNKFGEVQVKADGSTPGVVRFSQSLKLKRGTHPATELDEFVEVLGMGKRLRVPTLVFKKGGG